MATIMRQLRMFLVLRKMLKEENPGTAGFVVKVISDGSLLKQPIFKCVIY